MFPRRRALTALLLASGLLAIAVIPGHAIDVVRLKLGTLEGTGWSAQAVSVELNWLDAGHAGLQLHAQRAVLPEGLGELTGISLSCPRARLTTTEVRCTQGVLKAQSSVLGQQQIQIAFLYQLDSGDIDTSWSGIRLHGGTLDLTANLSGKDWHIDARGEALSLPALTRELAAAGVALPVVEGSGQLAVTASMSGSAAQFREAAVELQLRADELSDAGGREMRRIFCFSRNWMP